MKIYKFNGLKKEYPIVGKDLASVTVVAMDENEAISVFKYWMIKELRAQPDEEIDFTINEICDCTKSMVIDYEERNYDY